MISKYLTFITIIITTLCSTVYAAQIDNGANVAFLSDIKSKFKSNAIVSGIKDVLYDDEPVKSKVISDSDDELKEQDSILQVVSVPKGFEDLDENFQTLVDVYYGGRLISNVFAVVNNDTITFLDPTKAIREINSITDRELVVDSLTGVLDVNDGYSCFPEAFDGCGELKNIAVAGVIYNPDLFRVDVSINSKYLDKDRKFHRYTTSSQEGISSITAFNNIFSGSNGAKGRDSYSLNGVSMVSYKDTHLETTYNYSNGSRVYYDNIVAKHYNKDKEFTGGFSSMQNLSMVSSPRFLGVGMNSFFETLGGYDVLQGSKVEVFLPYRSRVKVSKDGRVLHSANYDMGNQLINTASLPSGAYNIDIEIEDNRGITTESRFFVKSFKMPPADRAVYYFDVGLLENRSAVNEKNIPEVTDNVISRVGLGKRITKNLAATGNVIASENELAGEVTFDLESKLFRISNSYLLTSKNDRGVSFSLSNGYSSLSRDNKFNYSFSFRKILQGDKDNSEINNTVFYDSVMNSSSRYSLSTSYAIKDGSVGFVGHRSKVGSVDPEYSYGPFIQRFFFKKYGFSLLFRGDITRYRDRTEYLANFRFNYGRGRWNFSSDTSKNFIKSQDRNSIEDNGFRTTQSISWQDGDLLDEDLHLSALHEFEDGDKKEEFGINYKSRFGRGDANVVHDKLSTRYNANLQFSLLSNKSNVAFGGREFKRGAVLTNVKGDKDSDARISVLSGRSVVETAKIGAVTPVMFSPFRNYEVSLSPTEDALADIDGVARTVGIMPGNVVTMDWDAKESIIVLGRVVARDGNPLPNVKIFSSLEVSNTDDGGMFQLYSYKDDRIIVGLGGGKKCEIEIPRVKANNGGVLDIGDVEICLDTVNIRAPEINKALGYSVTEKQVNVDDVVAIFSAEDLDGDSLTYSIAPKGDNGYFVIDPINGDVKLSLAGIKAVNDDSLGLTSLEVAAIASDGTYNSLQRIAFINVIRVKDAPVSPRVVVGVPNIKIPVMGDVKTFIIDEESIKSGTKVASFGVNGVGNGRIRYHLIKGNEGKYFDINKITGLVTLTQGGVLAVNDDKLNLTSFTISTVASNKAGRSKEQYATILIRRVNDNAPVVNEIKGSTLVEESVVIGDRVATFDATDLDGDEDILYSMLPGDSSAYFDLDKNTGIVTLTAGGVDSINNDNLNLTSLDVGIIAHSGPNSSDGAFASIVIDRINDNVPSIDTAIGSNIAGGTAAAGDVVATFNASDLDRDGLEYLIVSGGDNGYFEIDKNTGMVMLTQIGARDINDHDMYLIILDVGVVVSDGIHRSSKKVVSINITHISNIITVDTIL